uniref:Uncharacterized protein n=1 Tax=Rhizophora mucronata TaxID=61149 RepID=A0A2P2NSN4_RHIMU
MSTADSLSFWAVLLQVCSH